jgi:hypothetical protein
MDAKSIVGVNYWGIFFTAGNNPGLMTSLVEGLGQFVYMSGNTSQRRREIV